MTTIAGRGGDPFLQLAARLADTPRRAQATVRAAVQDAGRSVLDDARGKAGWSTRIPGSLALLPSFSQARPGVYVLSRSSVAPHARPYEGVTGRRELRHPLNYPSQRGGRQGTATHWVSQGVRPFLVPALAAQEPATVARIVAAVDEALAQSGL